MSKHGSKHGSKLGPLLLAIVLVMAACGGDTGTEEVGTASPAATATATATPTTADTQTPDTGEGEIEIEDFAFHPEEIEVAAGTEVTWKQRDEAPHTATAEDGSFDSGNLNEDEEFSHLFEEPGEYPYICTYHPEMTGTVIVS